MQPVIYHNPDCGTSRSVLEILRNSGANPIVVEYVKTGWTRTQLQGLFASANLTPKAALRLAKSPAADLGLLDANITSATLLDAMVAHPILVNRPFVCTPKGTRLCRPAETVYELLDQEPKDT